MCYSFATDEAAARKAITNIYRHTKLTGTVGLLKELVQEGLITGQYARELLEEMIGKGFWYKGDVPFGLAISDQPSAFSQLNADG